MTSKKVLKKIKLIFMMLTMMFLSVFAASCSYVSGEMVPLTIKFNPETALTKNYSENGLDKADWDKVTLSINQVRGNTETVFTRSFIRQSLSETEIKLNISVPIGSWISIEAEVYQKDEASGENDVLIGYGYGAMEEGTTVARENAPIYIEMDSSIEVVLHLNGGEFPERIKGSIGNVEVVRLYVKLGTDINEYLRENIPQRDDDVFVGWFLNFDPDFRWDVGSIYFVVSTIHLSVMWDSDDYLTYHTVTFMDEDDDQWRVVDVYEGVPFSSIITEPKIEERPGFIFVGWYKEESFINRWNFDVDVVTSNITLFAKWDRDVYPTYHVVTFNNGEIDYLWYANIADSDTIIKPENPIRQGYVFVGWFSRENDESSGWNFDEDVVTSDIRLYAMWARIPEMTITFNSNYGNLEIRTQKIQANSSALLDTNTFIRAGYEFIGWALMADKEEIEYLDEAEFAVGNIEEDAVITLYAVWEANLGDISIDIRWDDGDVEIVVIDNNIRISKKDNDFLTARVNEDYKDIVWSMWSIPLLADKEEEPHIITINAANYGIGFYRLDVIVWKNSIPYSAEIRFEVVE